ncbi:MAG: hypothetical protein AB7G06_04775 [Bdellovibrionales bacterium]
MSAGSALPKRPAVTPLQALRADAEPTWQPDVAFSEKLAYMARLDEALNLDLDEDTLYALTLCLDALTHVKRFQKDPYIAGHLGENTAHHSILTTLDIEDNLFASRRGPHWRRLRRRHHLSCLTHDFGEMATEFASFGRSVQLGIFESAEFKKNGKIVEDDIARRAMGLAFMARWRGDNRIFYDGVAEMRRTIGIQGGNVVDNPIEAQKALMAYMKTPLRACIPDISEDEVDKLEECLGVDDRGAFIHDNPSGLMGCYRTAEGFFGATGPIVKAAQGANGSDKRVELIDASVGQPGVIPTPLAWSRIAMDGPARNEEHLAAIAERTQPDSKKEREPNPELTELGEAMIRWVYRCSLRLVMRNPEVIMRNLRRPELDPDPTVDMVGRLAMNAKLAAFVPLERDICGPLHQHQMDTQTLTVRESVLAYLAMTVCEKMPLKSDEFKSGAPLIAWRTLPGELPVYVRLLDQFDQNLTACGGHPTRDWLDVPDKNSLPESEQEKLAAAADRIWKCRRDVVAALKEFHHVRRTQAATL